jgi:Neuraminidase (sialidase)
MIPREKKIKLQGRKRINSRKRITVLFFVILMTVLTLRGKMARAQQQQSKGNRVVLTLSYGPGNPRNSEGDFVTLKTGRILFIYTHFTNGSGDDSKAYLASRYSDDGGRTWSDHDEIVVKRKNDDNVMSVSLLRLKNGQIALFYVRKNSRADCIPVMRISADEAKTWGQPVPCITDRQGYFVLNNNRVIQLPNGRMLMPVAQHNWPGGRFTWTARLYAYYSDDEGKTWHSSDQVPNPDSVITQEPGIVVLKDGRLLMYIRTNAHVQYYAYSSDRGQHWTAARPSTISSPLAPASMAKMPDQNGLLLAWNDNGKTAKRTPLNTAISTDMGKTWLRERVVASDPNVNYCYSAIHFVGKYVLLGYAVTHPQGITIVVRRISLHWLHH